MSKSGTDTFAVLSADVSLRIVQKMGYLADLQISYQLARRC